MGAVKANEVSREELLTRDVHILFKENRQLKQDLEILRKQNLQLSKMVGRYKAQLEEQQKETNEDDLTAEEIAYYIFEQRKALGLSLNKFGDIFGVSGDTIANYERSRGSLKNAKKLIEKLRWYRKHYEKRD